MQRGVQVGLASGQAVARPIGAPVLSNSQLAPGSTVLAKSAFNGECPLWFYLLAESNLRASGTRLADVGGRIVAESIAGFLLADADSFVHTTWHPSPPIAPPVGPFRMQEFLKFAGVV